MSVCNEIYVDVKKIQLAHEYTLNRIYKCAYPRGRGTYGLVYALGGSAEYRFVTGEKVTVGAGDVFFVSGNSAYSIVTEQDFPHYTVNFEIHEETSNLGGLIPYHLFKSGDGDAPERIFRRLVEAWRQKNTGYEMRSLACLCEIFSILCRSLDQKNGKKNERLRAARERIEQEFAAPLNIDRLAYLSNMSVTNFRREWKRAYGETAQQYRDSLRLRYAVEHLESGYYSVRETAQRCGFEDVSYFVRFFKRKTGVTPAAFRDRNFKHID